MVIVYMLAAFVLAGLIALGMLYHSKALRMTSSTAAEVVRSDWREVRDADERREETIVVCKYTVGGRDYQVECIVPGRNSDRYPIGRKLTIRYNPSDPEMADLPAA